MASRLAHGEGILEEETAEEVLRHGEEVQEHCLMGQGTAEFDALAAFEDRIRAGRVLDAIILMDSGKATGRPSGS
jgi:hypothetical protein